MKIDDITYILDGLGGSGSYKQSGDHLMADCPLAPWTHSSGHDGGKKMGVLIQQGMAPVNCFYPGCYHGTLLGLVAECGGKRVGAGEMTLEEVSNLKAFVIMAEDEEVDGKTLKSAVMPVPADITAAIGKGSPYWRARGVPASVEKSWLLGEARGRALIPIIDQKGVVVGIQGRIMPGCKDEEEAEVKYRTWPSGFEREKYLSGEHMVKKPVDLLIVVESPNDAMMLNGWLPDLAPTALPFDTATEGVVAVATMGGKFSERQVQRMVDLMSANGEIAVGFDSDHAGRLGQRQLIDLLRRRVAVVTEVTWSGKDPSANDGGKLGMNVVKATALKAVAVRTSWLDARLKTLLTNR